MQQNNKLIIIVIITVFSCNAFGWGKIGHRVTGEIASKYLTKKSKRQISKLLGTDTMAQVSTWADSLKSEKKYRDQYSHLHYVSIRKGTKLVDRTISTKGDILSGIEDFSKTLKSKKSPLEERKKAIKFLIHLIGDIHQPLHVGYNNDRGGNDISLTWFGYKTNLHQIWDEKLIQLEELSFTEYTDFINHPKPSDVKKWQKDKLDQWAIESRSYLPSVYKFQEKKHWEYEYSYRHLKFLNKRLLMGGIRLAGHLNKIFK